MDKGHKIFVDRVEDTCEKYAKKTAIIYMRESGQRTHTTYGEILNGNKKIGDMLKKAGVNEGDRVAIVSPHSPQAVLAGLGLAYCNFTTVLIDASLPYDEINRLITYADVRSAFTTTEIYEELDEEIIKDIPVFQLCDTENEYERFESSAAKVMKEPTDDAEKDVIAVMFSSGTTAQMKGIKVTYSSVVKAAEIFVRNVKWKAEYKYLHVFPFNHIAGYATIHAFLSCGSEIALIEKMNATKLQAALLEYEPHGFGMIPKVFEMMEDKVRENLRSRGALVEKLIDGMLSISGFLRRTFGIKIGRKVFKFITKQVFGRNITTIGTGASLCRKSTSKFFIDMGLNWANFYALTETNVPAVSTGVFDPYPVAMAGNVRRNPEIDIKINNPDSAGVGEIYVKGELLMKGYFRDDELTKRSFDGGYFKTGDYGYVDKKGNLYVTGRVKESILLHNGKKVSPTDVDNYYATFVSGVTIASCGYTRENETFDEVHMFIQTKGLSEEDVKNAETSLQQASQQTKNLYKLEGIHRIETIPMTSVGKVKRFELKKQIQNEVIYTDEQNNKIKFAPDIEGMVKQVIIEVLKENVEINESTRLQDDLNMDSLAIYELGTKLEIMYGRNLMNMWEDIKTVGDLVDYISKNNAVSHKKRKRSITEPKYPLPRTKKDVRFMKLLIWIMERYCDVEIKGNREFKEGETYIFAPNHSSHFDTVCVYKALYEVYGKEVLMNTCCMAAHELADNRFMKRVFGAIGAVPVDRMGNSAAALKMMNQCLASKKYQSVIFPEGTRTRTGEMGKFLEGTASVAISTKTSIIPVGITGTYEIWPPHKKRPIFSLRKKKVVVNLGKPINVEGYDHRSLTERIEKEVRKLCDK